MYEKINQTETSQQYKKENIEIITYSESTSMDQSKVCVRSKSPERSQDPIIIKQMSNRNQTKKILYIIQQQPKYP